MGKGYGGFNPRSQEAEAADLCEFQASQDYIVRPWKKNEVK